MYVRMISFGSNWWAAQESARRPAWFNSTGFRCGSRLRPCPVFDGQIRFNQRSGFHPAFRMHAVGRTFCCDEPHLYDGRMHLLVKSLAPETAPDACLVTLTDCLFGQILFKDRAWCSAELQPISISRRHNHYEAMFLMRPNDWLKTSIGTWRLNQAQRSLMLCSSTCSEAR